MTTKTTKTVKQINPVKTRALSYARRQLAISTINRTIVSVTVTNNNLSVSKINGIIQPRPISSKPTPENLYIKTLGTIIKVNTKQITRIAANNKIINVA